MRIKLARFDSVIDLDENRVTTLEVNERSLFTRVVSSFRSELGERAVEPYYLFEGERNVSPKGKMLFIDSLPELPIHDKAFEKRLYDRLLKELETSPESECECAGMEQLGTELGELILGSALSLWGTYGFELNWELLPYLKAFKFGVRLDGTETFLEKWIHFFKLCVDIELGKPLVVVNLKSFLTGEELEELFSQAFFHEVSLLLLESWKDDRVIAGEHKICIEQGFLEL